jgi:DNA-binding LacI/PurR family transcriptional regulator
VYIAGPRYLSTENERFEGFTKALEEEGLQLNDDLILHGEYKWSTTYEEVTWLLEDESRFTQYLPQVTSWRSEQNRPSKTGGF